MHRTVTFTKVAREQDKINTRVSTG